MLKHSFILGIIVLTLGVCSVQVFASKTAAILVRDFNSLDVDENNIKTFMDSSGISYDIVDANMIKNETFNLSDYNALYMRTGSEPVSYNDSNVISKIQTMVSNGGSLILEYYGNYLGTYLSIGTCVIQNWHPMGYNANYFVEERNSSPIFNNIDTWSPPTLPDDNDQLVTKLAQTNMDNYFPWFTFNSGTQNAPSYWDLYTTYGWPSLPTNSDYCLRYPGLCTPERSVQSSGHFIRFINFGAGRIYTLGLAALQDVSVSHLIIGRPANKIRKNIVLIEGHGCINTITGDLNNDCRVDFYDFAIMAGNWLVDYN